MKIKPQSIPAELRERDQWVVWRLMNGRKMPFGRDGQPADTTDPRTWLSYAQAHSRVKMGDVQGLGFVFTRGSGYVGVDLDDCYAANARTVLLPWAHRIVHQLRSWTERSPSGHGLHIIVRAPLPPNVRHKTPVNGGAIELYSSKRYFTITGRAFTYLGGEPLAERRYERIRTCPGALASVIAEHGLLKAPPVLPAASKPRLTKLSDAAVLKAIKVNDPREHAALFERPYVDGEDRSQLDFRLAALITRYVGRDPERIARVMWRSTLGREKWQRPDYLPRTVARAIQSTDTFVIVRRPA